MINKLSKNYSKTLLTLFIVGNVGPIVARTITEMDFANWQQITSYVFTVLSAIAVTCISFFTNSNNSTDEV
jgi:uncharacterized membrane protein